MKKLIILTVWVYVCTCTTALAQPTQPASALAGNSSNCSAPLSETCISTSGVVTIFKNGVLRTGSPTSLPAVYSFYNVTTMSGKQINATVTIDAQSNCDMSSANFSIDDDTATDQDGNSIAEFFAPRITPAVNLTSTDMRGYVQFTIRFFMENGTPGQQYPADFSTPPAFGGLAGLNYIHYDIDGFCDQNGGWFRETGLVKNVPGTSINGNAPTELAAYNYMDGMNWTGFAGSIYERTGVSRCAQVAAAANFSTPQTEVTVRMGYDYNYNGISLNTRPTRQYGSRFGCFSFPQPSVLPVKLLSFNGSLKENITLLNWAAENQIDFSLYDIQRSENGVDFKSIATIDRKGTGIEKQEYQYADNLTSITGNTFYYRLRMIDIDGRFTYSNVILIRTDVKKQTGLVISPNPVVNGGTATVRFESTNRKTIELRVIDLSGKILLKQQNRVQEGTNSVAINHLGQLSAGMYILQMNDEGSFESIKFTVYR